MVATILLMDEILHQLIGSLSHYLQDVTHPRWCRISSINRMFVLVCADSPVPGCFIGPQFAIPLNVRFRSDQIVDTFT